MSNWKKTLLLLSMGAATFAFPFPGGCAQYLQNSDLVTFYQTSGGQMIETIFDPARFGDPTSDWSTIVVNPTITTLQTVWNHWVWTQFPQDPVPNFN